ncbi:MAG: YhdH/YhfP family quinone oxidoreductase [Bacteroidetes bacterium]|nr:YhdH/YhfP family quinone oxidoreductase [Bacteroidota bacterium]
MKQFFKALVVDEINSTFQRNIKNRNIADLPDNDILIKVHYSSLNYKDVLSATGNKGITRNYPHTPGIDAAGIVTKSKTAKFKEGDEVIVTGYDLGMNTSGGFGEYINVPSDWVVPKPDGISLRTAMIVGTAGFTAMSGVLEIINYGIKPEDGKIVVSGATGGVGIMATNFLSKLGYEVVVSSGKKEQYPLLEKAGANEIFGRELLNEDSKKPILPQKWIAGIDTVGGNVLTNILKSVNKYGIVCTCGNIVSTELQTSIFPFILRGVRLIGLASAETYMQKRLIIWDKIASRVGFFNFDFLTKEIKLEDLNSEIDLMLAGNQVGRVLIKL